MSCDSICSENGLEFNESEEVHSTPSNSLWRIYIINRSKINIDNPAGSFLLSKSIPVFRTGNLMLIIKKFSLLTMENFNLPWKILVMNQYFTCICYFMSRNIYFLFYSIVFCLDRPMMTKRIQTIPLAAYLFDKEEKSEDKDHKTKKSCWVQLCLQQW